MRTIITALAMVIATVSTVKAQDVDTTITKSFLDGCRDKADDHNFSFCVGYVIGVSQFLVHVGTNAFVCFPKGVTSDQLITAVLKYADSHKSEWDKGPLTIVLPAMAAAFPCPK